MFYVLVVTLGMYDQEELYLFELDIRLNNE